MPEEAVSDMDDNYPNSDRQDHYSTTGLEPDYPSSGMEVSYPNKARDLSDMGLPWQNFKDVIMEVRYT